MQTANMFFKHKNYIQLPACCTFLRTSVFCLALIFFLDSTVAAQVISETSTVVPVDCQATYKRALELFQEYDAKMSLNERKVADDIVERTQQKGSTRADGYNEYGGGAMMLAHYAPAAWGGLKAATLEWNPRHVSNVGIYLSYLNRFEDANLFLQCASKMAPQSPFVIEARAMLAYRQNDFNTAKLLIEQAVRMMPGDMNVRYTAGVIFYKAGDRLNAKKYLQEANRIAPDYPTISKALKVADPGGQSSSSPPKDVLDKLVAECYRFMDEMLVSGEKAGRYLEEMRIIEGTSDVGTPVGGDTFESLRLSVKQSKTEIANLEKKARDTKNSARSVDWNATIQECISAFLITTVNYQNIINDRGVDILFAQSMGMEPIRMIEKIKLHHGTNPYKYLIQDEKFKYYLIEDPARKAYEAGAKLCEGRSDDEACRKPYLEAYCSIAIPAWISHWKNVLANMRSAEANFPDVAKAYANNCKQLANQVADYSKRGLSAMKPVTEADLKYIPAASRQIIIGVASPEAHAKFTKDLYKSYIGLMIKMVSFTITHSNEIIMDALDTTPDAFFNSSFYIDDCQQKPEEGINLDAELEKLLAAVMEASEYEASFEPECELEIGGWKLAFKPFSLDNSPNLENSDIKVSVDPANNRWGGEYGKSVDGNYGPLTGEVSVKVWGEGNIVGGNADYGVQLEGKVGLGVKKKGVGGFACYFATQTYKFNARAFGEALTR